MLFIKKIENRYAVRIVSQTSVTDTDKRRVTFANKEETVRRVCLKIERYRCRCCGRTFAVGCEMIGLGKYQRRNKPIVHASQAGETNKSIAARKGAKE